MSIVSRIRETASKHGLKLAEIERALGFSNSSIRKWDQSPPSVDKVLAVATYLNVPLNYLVTGDTKEYIPSHSILEKYNQLNEEDKKKVDAFIEISLLDTKIVYTTPNITDSSKQIQESFTPYVTRSPIAVLGKVAAGKPIEGISIPLDYISAPVNADYALIAQGHSMEPVIQDGDYIYVKNCNELHTGDIGIFYIDGEVTCKKYYPQPDCIILKSLNPDFTPFKYPLNKWLDFKIQGKVLLSDEQKNRCL